MEIKAKHISIFLLRILLGLVFLVPGIKDVITPGWSASGFLTNATSGPLVSFYQSLVGSPVVDVLVSWGLLLIGLALLLGVAVRFASASGIIMMFLFYLATFPPERNLIEEHIIYIAALFVLMSTAAGRFLGLDHYIEKRLPKNAEFLKLFLG